jgi:coenzyme F420-dependent glucose-6-phosphate dehydrogenase
MTDTRYGLTLSSEQHPPSLLIDTAVAAEQAGFDFVSISDHFHPWISEQGHSPFVWTVLGAIAQATDTIEVGVGVSCPIIRMHPAIHAHAVATAATLLDGRFVWGVGTGENLNEHVLGDRWPPTEVRQSMLAEAIQLIRELWTGESVTHRGEHYTVEDARIFDLPESLPPILVSAYGEMAAGLAAEHGDGLWFTGLRKDMIEHYRGAGGDGPIWTQLTVAWDTDKERAVERAHRIWPNTALAGQLAADLRTVLNFEEAVTMVSESDIEESIHCGPDPEPVVEAIVEAREMGIDHIYLHQIGDPLGGFLDFWTEEIKPEL